MGRECAPSVPGPVVAGPNLGRPILVYAVLTHKIKIPFGNPTGQNGRGWSMFRPLELVEDGAGPIPVPCRPLVLDGDGSSSIPDKVLWLAPGASPFGTHTVLFLNPRRIMS
jgi:hypothetical protein